MRADIKINDDESEYWAEIQSVINLCTATPLDLNISRTKGMMCDFRRKKQHSQPSANRKI